MVFKRGEREKGGSRLADRKKEKEKVERIKQTEMVMSKSLTSTMQSF